MASRRVESLVKSCRKVVVVSKDFNERLEKLAARRPNLELFPKRLDPGDDLDEHMKDANLVIAATGDPALNLSIAKAGRSMKKLVNRVDSPKDSDVIFPAVLRRGDVIISVSTGSPLLSKELRRRLEKTVTNTDARMAKLLDRSRELATREVGEDRERRRALKKVASDTIIREMLNRGSLREAKTRARRIILGHN